MFAFYDYMCNLKFIDYICNFKIMDISKTEHEVMEAIWLGHPCTAQDVVARLSKEKPWHEKTVKTLLGRLLKKGALGFEKDGRSYRYFPLIERHEYTRTESQSFLHRFFGGRLSPFVANFADEEKLEKEDIEELKALIKKWERDND